MQTVFTIFIILHGLVHLLYAAQSQKVFELKPGMVWPDGSWALSRILGDPTTRFLVTIVCGLAVIGFVGGGIGILAGQTWWRTLVVAAAIFSAVGFALFWDGSMHNLDGQGWIGVLIDVGIVVAVLVLKWPEFQF